jgi:uncharacterized membrane protein (DUF2068 family)
MDWNLYRCGRIGHITYAPDEPELREYMHATAPAGELWRCLRCGTFVKDKPAAAGSAEHAPVVKRGREIRSELILRVFAVERFARFLLFGGVAYAIWQFSTSKRSIEETFNRDLPIVKSMLSELGFNIGHSQLLLEFRKVLHFSQGTLALIAVGVAAFAVVELVEGIGLWLSKRWGEYFAMVVTSLGLPYEIYDLTLSVTWTKLALIGINIALVLYLILTKRLLGVRGGRRAYEDALRSDSLFDQVGKEAAAAHDAKAVQEADDAARAEARAQRSAT